MNPISDFWQARTEREQIILIALGAFLAAALLYFALIAPTAHARAHLRKQVTTAEQTLPKMISLHQKIQQSRPFITSKAHTVPLTLATLSSSLAQFQLQAYAPQIKQSQDQAIQINWDTIPFDAVIAWLEHLWQTQATAVTKLHVQALPEAGMVKAGLVFK